MTHRQVDVTTLVEISAPQGPFGLPHVLRNADVPDVPDLTAELHRMLREPTASRSGRSLEQAAPIATRIGGHAKSPTLTAPNPPRCLTIETTYAL